MNESVSQETIGRLRAQRQELLERSTRVAQRAATEWFHGESVDLVTIQLLIDELEFRRRYFRVLTTWYQVIHGHAENLLDFFELIQENGLDPDAFWMAFASTVADLWRATKTSVMKVRN